MSTYPSAIDTFTTAVTGNPIPASTTNNQNSAIIAIEQTLGTNPQLVGPGYSTVAAAISAALSGNNLYLASSFT